MANERQVWVFDVQTTMYRAHGASEITPRGFFLVLKKLSTSGTLSQILNDREHWRIVPDNSLAVWFFFYTFLHEKLSV